MKRVKGLVAGVGINDVPEPVITYVNGVKTLDTTYRVWSNMINRCYRPENLKRNTTYKECTVCDDWLYFSKFREWMLSQDYEGKSLDKDLLVGGNKVYSPFTCMFIDLKVNSSLTLSNKIRGECPLGVCYENSKGYFRAACHNGIEKVYLGGYKCPQEAHRKWQLYKITTLNNLKDSQPDFLVKIGLQRIIDKIQYQYDNNLETIDFN